MRSLSRSLAAAAALLLAAAAAWTPKPVDVFIGDGAPVPQYRIPALVVTGKGTLLAFAEARYHPETDCGWKYLVVRRSVDGGLTWTKSDLIIAGYDIRNSTATGNPMAVFHPQSGRVVVTFAAQFLPSAYCSPNNAGVFVVDDSGTDGETWGLPRNISGMLGPVVARILPGPGAGLVLTSASGAHAGRIVMSGTTSAYGQDFTFFSDDGGNTWTPGQTSLAGMDESALVELPDGRVIINMRNDHLNKSCDCRAYAVSTDAGASFSLPIQYDPVLISPVCQASVLRVGDTVYFANPANKTSRSNVTIRRGTGLAGGWSPNVLTVLPGDAWGGYTSIVGPIDIANTTGGLVFEHWSSVTNKATISFVAFPLSF